METPPIMTHDPTKLADEVRHLVNCAAKGDNPEVVTNAILALRRPTPPPDVAKLRAAAVDALSGWRYIRHMHGDLSGVGWNRVEDALTAALASQDAPSAPPSDDVVERLTAVILDEVARQDAFGVDCLQVAHAVIAALQVKP